MKQLGHAAGMKDESRIEFYLENTKGRDHMKYLDIDWGILLKLKLKKLILRMWAGFI